jgi:hypothetical protein
MSGPASWLRGREGADADDLAADLHQLALSMDLDVTIVPAAVRAVREVVSLLGNDPRLVGSDRDGARQALAGALRHLGPAGTAHADRLLSGPSPQEAAGLWCSPPDRRAIATDLILRSALEQRAGGVRLRPTPARTTSDRRAFGVRAGVIEPVLAALATGSELREAEEGTGYQLVDERGRPELRVEPVAGVAEPVAQLLRQLRRDAFGTDGIRLIRFVVNELNRQRLRKRSGELVAVPQQSLVIPRGWLGLADALGGRTSGQRLRKAVQMLQRLRLVGAEIEVGGLLMYIEGRRGRHGGKRQLALTAALPLCPEYSPRRHSNLVPVPDWDRDPPFLSSPRTYGRQLAMQQLWLIEMRRHWDRLEELGGIRVPPGARAELESKLSQQVDLERGLTNRILDHWRAGSDGTPPFIEVQGDIWTLAGEWEPELAFLREGAAKSKKASKRARRTGRTKKGGK